MTPTTNAQTIQASTGIRKLERRRRVIMGVIFLVAAIFIWIVFVSNLDPGVETRYVMNPGGGSAEAADWILPSILTLNIIAFLCGILGAYQIIRGFGKFTYGILALVSILFIFGFLTWATAGGQTNLAGLLRVTVVRAVKAFPQCLQYFGMNKLLLINGALCSVMVHRGAIWCIISPLFLPTDLGNKTVFRATYIQQI